MIRKATQVDLMEIVALHTKCFPDSKLGMHLLFKYYKEFLEAGDIFLVNVDDTNINGFVVGTHLPSVRQNNFIKNNTVELGIRTLQLLITFDKGTWIRVWKRIFSLLNANPSASEKKPNDNTGENYPILVSICVSNDCKGKGIGRKLVEEFEKQLLNLGYQGYTLAVRKTNDRAVRFYKKLGMSLYRETAAEYGLRKRLVGFTID